MKPAQPKDNGRTAPRFSRLLWLWGPVAAYCLLIFLLSSASNLPELPEALSDKVAHVLLYSGLGFLLARALAGGLGHPLPGWVPPLVLLLAVLYGVSDEIHQLFVPRRQFDLFDMAADAAGAGLGVGALWLWSIISRPGNAFR